MSVMRVFYTPKELTQVHMEEAEVIATAIRAAEAAAYERAAKAAECAPGKPGRAYAYADDAAAAIRALAKEATDER